MREAEIICIRYLYEVTKHLSDMAAVDPLPLLYDIRERMSIR
jgi:hypothetical protein